MAKQKAKSEYSSRKPPKRRLATRKKSQKRRPATHKKPQKRRPSTRKKTQKRRPATRKKKQKRRTIKKTEKYSRGLAGAKRGRSDNDDDYINPVSKRSKGSIVNKPDWHDHTEPGTTSLSAPIKSRLKSKMGSAVAASSTFHPGAVMAIAQGADVDSSLGFNSVGDAVVGSRRALERRSTLGKYPLTSKILHIIVSQLDILMQHWSKYESQAPSQENRAAMLTTQNEVSEAMVTGINDSLRGIGKTYGVPPSEGELSEDHPLWELYVSNHGSIWVPNLTGIGEAISSKSKKGLSKIGVMVSDGVNSILEEGDRQWQNASSNLGIYMDSIRKKTGISPDMMNKAIRLICNAGGTIWEGKNPIITPEQAYERNYDYKTLIKTVIFAILFIEYYIEMLNSIGKTDPAASWTATSIQAASDAITGLIECLQELISLEQGPPGGIQLPITDK